MMGMRGSTESSQSMDGIHHNNTLLLIENFAIPQTRTVVSALEPRCDTMAPVYVRGEKLFAFFIYDLGPVYTVKISSSLTVSTKPALKLKELTVSLLIDLRGPSSGWKTYNPLQRL